jgi:outer membrane autotransporter protein
LRYGYSIYLGNGFTLAPEAGAQYGRLALDSATEQGASVLGLVLPGRIVYSTRSLAGVRVAKSFDGPGTAFTIEGRTSWSHEFSRIGDLRMRFTGDSWTDGFDLAAPRQLYDSALTGVTMAGTVRRSLRLFVTFDSEISGPVNTWTGNAGIVKSW